MRSSWLWREGSPRRSLIIGGLLLALGLWDLFFVLFRSEDLLFTAGAAVLLPGGGLQHLRGGVLLALGLWDLFFVLFRSEDLLFTAGAALLLLVGSLNIWWGISRPGRGTTGSGPAR